MEPINETSDSNGDKSSEDRPKVNNSDEDKLDENNSPINGPSDPVIPENPPAHEILRQISIIADGVDRVHTRFDQLTDRLDLIAQAFAAISLCKSSTSSSFTAGGDSSKRPVDGCTHGKVPGRWAELAELKNGNYGCGCDECVRRGEGGGEGQTGKFTVEDLRMMVRQAEKAYKMEMEGRKAKVEAEEEVREKTRMEVDGSEEKRGEGRVEGGEVNNGDEGLEEGRNDMG
ncbi:hypothetical protein ABW19_dt0207471 [Dactylella cylindrospora]|nr:hypothetical protein ABW19_dt0207471 [Dactylella cylindrospora]